MTIAMAVRNGAVFVREDLEIGDEGVPVYLRAELGVRPGHEVVYLTGEVRATVATWSISRAQEGTTAEDWPAGTPLCFLPAASDPTGEVTVYLAHSLASGSREIDLQGVYRRVKVGSEIMWDTNIVGDAQGTSNSERTSYRHPVERGREGTTEASHAAGATVTVLGPGQS